MQKSKKILIKKPKSDIRKVCILKQKLLNNKIEYSRIAVNETFKRKEKVRKI